METELLKFGGSLLAISLLVFLVWRLRLGGIARIEGEAGLRELADESICGFEPIDFAIDANGLGAVCLDASGRILLLAPHGVNFAGRLLGKGSFARREGAMLVIGSSEPSLPIVSLDLGEASGAWAARIGSLNS